MRPFMSLLKSLYISYSAAVSSAAVGSSSIRTEDSLYKARVKASYWLSPPENSIPSLSKIL